MCVWACGWVVAVRQHPSICTVDGRRGLQQVTSSSLAWKERSSSPQVPPCRARDGGQRVGLWRAAPSCTVLSPTTRQVDQTYQSANHWSLDLAGACWNGLEFRTEGSWPIATSISDPDRLGCPVTNPHGVIWATAVRLSNKRASNTASGTRERGGAVFPRG